MISLFAHYSDSFNRLTAAQAMKHKWLTTQLGVTLTNRASVSYASDRGQTFRRFMAMQKLKKAALSDIASQLTKEEVGILGDIFARIDKDGDGTLTLQDLDEALKHGKRSSMQVAFA
jgi:hypothetical protein